MYTRRMATFLLGLWIGCGALLALLALENLHTAARVMANPSPPAGKLIDKLGTDDASLLLNYQAAEQTRYYLTLWENAQFALAGMLGAFLYSGTQKKVLPLVLCGAMLVAVLFQHFAVMPELAFRGRETDFPPGSTAFGTRTRVLLLAQVYWGAEMLKLLMGTVLAVYLFAFRTRKRTRTHSTSLAA